MYIKQIVIQGFKSYRDQTIIEPFHPRHNVIVGRNGSGKSNIFNAIQFVLSDEFSYLRPEQRQALLHEGNGPRVISAYVEIIFDNADGRLPIDQEEVFLRRVIASKKDQYFLNRKVVPRSDVMNLLESAGFSRCNPYYIVKQGKINQMATAPDSHRLKLLREVAGTRVYDERREESKALLKESESKREKIDEFLETIEERWLALQEEKDELKEYQKWDSLRRSLEFTIYNRDLKDTRRKLEEMEKRRADSGEEQSRFNAALQRANDKLKTASRQLKELKTEVASATDQRDSLMSENQQLLKDKARLELNIRDLSDEVDGDNHSKEHAETELAQLLATISEKERELAAILPHFETVKRKEDELNQQIVVKERALNELYTKQGRGSQFTSKEQRDQWIKTELKSLNKQISDKKQQIEHLATELTGDTEQKEQLLTRIQEVNADIARYRSGLDDQNRGYLHLRKERDSLHNSRNELWRRENTLQQTLASLKEDNARAEHALRSLVGKPTLNGRLSVAKVLQTFRERGGECADWAAGHRGLVVDLFTCDAAMNTAVDVTASNRLFHHVVDTDMIGTQILKEMNRQNLPGEVTFMPLNRLMIKKTVYPKTDNAFPMISRLQFDDDFDAALRHIFGRTMVCRSLEVATQLARAHRLDCVTVDGDQAMARGTLTGGFFNAARSRLDTHRQCCHLDERLEDVRQQLDEVVERLREIELQINRLVSDQQRAETKNGKARDVFDQVNGDVRLIRSELTGLERAIVGKQSSLTTLRANYDSMMATRNSLKMELNQELVTQLSADELRQTDRLLDELRQLNAECRLAAAERLSAEAAKGRLENALQSNLYRRRDRLHGCLHEVSVCERRRQLTLADTEMTRCVQLLADTSGRLAECDTVLARLQQNQQLCQADVERWTAKVKDVTERMYGDAKHLEKMVGRQNLLQQRIAECTRKIWQLGSLPSDAFDTYQHLSSKQLFAKLELANSELRKYSNVNKKALDQFVHFSEQKEKLVHRKHEQEKGHAKIMELMSVLEQRKFEAIYRTFQQVSAYFSDVFSKLVPRGRAQLLMRKGRDELDTSDVRISSTVDTFTGVGIRVSFSAASSDSSGSGSGGGGEMRELNQLSGGQKSLVALALIFAIQRCDPAPFYLFDEIDQALDPSHRRSVANMIKHLSQGAQFITTTFRPELLEHADKFYGVMYRNKLSHVVHVSREEAHDFVEDDSTHG